MFRELQLILSSRTLVITVAAMDDRQIRLTITPRAASKEDQKAPCVPFIVEGSAEELDAELAAALVGYTAQQLSCSRAAERVTEAVEAELKAVKDEAARRVAEARKTNTGKTGLLSKPKEEAPARPVAEPRKPDPPPMLSLFGDAPGQAASPEETTTASQVGPGVAIAGPETTDEDDEEQYVLREASYDGAQDEDVAA